jgi:hypothetical protein
MSGALETSLIPSTKVVRECEWTEAHEDILKEWKAKCFVNLWLQDKSAYYYVRLYNFLSYPVIMLSSVSSAALFSSDNHVLKYIAGVMTLCSGVLTAVTRQLKPGEMYQQHALTTRRYTNLLRNIDICLSLTVTMRPSPAHFLDKIGLEIENLASNQLDPPLNVIKRFERKYGPLDKMLYGEDIVELLKIELHANKMFRKVKKNARFSEDAASDGKNSNLEFVYGGRNPPSNREATSIDINKLSREHSIFSHDILIHKKTLDTLT